MIVTDYNTLVSAVQGYVEDNGDEFTELIPNFIRNACQTIVREVDGVGFSELVSVTANALSPNVVIPADTFIIESVAKTSAGNKKFLKSRPYTYCVYFWPAVTSGGGNPKYYNRLNDLDIYVSPTPTSTQELEVKRVTVSIPSSSNPSCYILDKYPSLLLSRVMVEACLVKKDMEDAEKWGAMYEREKAGIAEEARANRKDEGYQQVPSRVTNTPTEG